MGKYQCGRLKGNLCGPLRPNTINVTMPSHGLPDSIYRGLVPSPWSQSRSCRATNSGPLPERIGFGIPRHSITSGSVSITSYEFSLRATRSARHSRVYSSISASIRNNLPSCVRGIDEVVAPDRISSLWTKPDTGTVIEPQPSSRPLFLRNFQPLTPPDPLHPVPACLPS